MKIRLLLAAICIVSLPMWFSPSNGDNLNNSAPFVTVAVAGHTSLGNWCECGAPGCICDPGETQTWHAAPPTSDAPPVQPEPRTEPDRVSDLDFGSAAFLLGLALFMWSRFRA